MLLDIDYLSVELMDYCDLPTMGRQFEQVVSVGMMEHVGMENYQLFIDCVNKALKEGGLYLYLLYFISAFKEHPGDAWVKKYIFPGGVAPSLQKMISCVAEDNFHTLDVESFRMHYNCTPLCWEKNFREHIDEVRVEDHGCRDRYKNTVHCLGNGLVS